LKYVSFGAFLIECCIEARAASARFYHSASFLHRWNGGGSRCWEPYRWDGGAGVFEFRSGKGALALWRGLGRVEVLGLSVGREGAARNGRQRSGGSGGG
jgi:hypothetical protein